MESLRNPNSKDIFKGFVALGKRARNTLPRLTPNRLRAIGILAIIALISTSPQRNLLNTDGKDYYEPTTSQEVKEADTRFTIGIFIQKISVLTTNQDVCRRWICMGEVEKTGESLGRGNSK